MAGLTARAAMPSGPQGGAGRHGRHPAAGLHAARQVARHPGAAAGAHTAGPHLHVLTAVEVFHVGRGECPLFLAIRGELVGRVSRQISARLAA